MSRVLRSSMALIKLLVLLRLWAGLMLMAWEDLLLGLLRTSVEDVFLEARLFCYGREIEGYCFLCLRLGYHWGIGHSFVLH